MYVVAKKAVYGMVIGEKYKVSKCTNADGEVVPLSKAHRTHITVDGVEFSLYSYEFEAIPVFDELKKGSQVTNLITKEVRYVIGIKKGFVIVKDGQEKLAWPLNEIAILKDTENILNTNNEKTNMSLLEELINEKDFDEEFIKQISEKGKELIDQINEKDKAIDEIEKDRAALRTQYDILEDGLESRNKKLITDNIKFN